MGKDCHVESKGTVAVVQLDLIALRQKMISTAYSINSIPFSISQTADLPGKDDGRFQFVYR